MFQVERDCKVHGVTLFRAVDKAKSKFRCRKCLSEAVQRRRVKLKQLAVEYKGGSCIACGYNKCLEALEFHHTDPTQKDFGISSNGDTKSFERIKSELDKCVLLCCRCHREKHVELKIS